MAGKFVLVDSIGDDDCDDSFINGNNDPAVCDIGIIIDDGIVVNNCPHDRDNEVGDVEFAEFIRPAAAAAAEEIIELGPANAANVRSLLADVDVDLEEYLAPSLLPLDCVTIGVMPYKVVVGPIIFCDKTGGTNDMVVGDFLLPVFDNGDEEELEESSQFKHKSL